MDADKLALRRSKNKQYMLRLAERKAILSKKFPEVHKYICKVNVYPEKLPKGRGGIKTDMFDYVIVNATMAISNYDKCLEFVENNKSDIIEYILYNVEHNQRYEKYNFPIESLNIDDMVLLRSCDIRIKLSPKKPDMAIPS